MNFYERHADAILKDRRLGEYDATKFQVSDCPYDLEMIDCLHNDSKCLTCYHNQKIEIDEEDKC